MRKVYSSPYIAECDQLRMSLSSEGIRSEMRNEFGHPIGLVVIGGVCDFAAPEVWVDDSDHEDAMIIVNAFVQSLKDASGPTSENPACDGWPCPRCGETVDATFNACWNCDTPRP
ncbi:MAG: DUF2007 domain-containing protein [Kiritimatiellia bacterium]